VNLKLPKFPYKGLRYYGPEDKLIFAAREDDIWRCSQILAKPSTRILILHGRTGCGKSSFLRAGLITFLETQERGFQFQKEGGNPASTLFIRCTDKPLVQLAERLYSEVTEGHHELRTPDGQTTSIDLTEVHQGRDCDTFLQDVAEDPDQMIESLGVLASLLPRTLVVIIDQAEEILTVRQDEEGRKWGEQFFNFLALFSRSRLDLKLLVALRTEWYGQFYNAIRQRRWDPMNIRDYLLSELTQDQIAIAIKHPSQFREYNFSFDNGLPEKIALDLKNSPLEGGVLPVMQLICERLYRQKGEMTDEGKHIQITNKDYLALGGAEGQLGQYIRESLLEIATLNKMKSHIAELEIERWCIVLATIVRTQIDGTVTTDFRTSVDLLNKCKEVNCKIPFEQMIPYLTDEKRRILQRTEIFNPRTKETHVAYSLGHDAIGLALKILTQRTAVSHSLIDRMKRLYRYFGVIMLFLAIVIWGVGIATEKFNSREYGFVVFLYGALSLIFSYLPTQLLEKYLKPLLSILKKRRERDSTLK
jgi:hypothetical protein